jgi:hypothetical protein
LRDKSGGEDVAAAAAELGRHGHAEVAHASERGHNLRRPPFLVVHPLLKREQFVAGVVVGLVENFALLVA